ncbi:MAG: TlpA family protein disulfide reductase [Catenulispora sp.]|nr:TlpA family protein disulfide reductase [Catenulispora sp.]
MPPTASRPSRLRSLVRRPGLVVAVVVVVVAAGVAVWRLDQPSAAARQRAAQQDSSATTGLTTYPSGNRPPAVTGDTLDGGKLTLADLRGHVVVLNVWGSWCMPCRKEAPDLALAAHETAPRGVRFVGIDTRDNAASAQAFVRTFKIPYPSLVDKDGQLLLAFNGIIPVSAVPSTVVGRITYDTLRGMIDDETRGGGS